jgi:histidine triad (HIT) family protein
VSDEVDSVPPGCFVCRKQASGDALGAGVIYEDDVVFASHVVANDPMNDVYLGYVFVETTRHVAGLGELTDAEASAVGRLTNDVAAALRSEGGAEHVYSYVYGDGVAHLHVHLQARYPGTPVEHWPQRSGDGAITVNLSSWPDAPRGDLAAIRELTDRLSRAVAARRRSRAG